MVGEVFCEAAASVSCAIRKLKTPKQTRQHGAPDTNFVVPVLPDGSQRRQTGATRGREGEGLLQVYHDHKQVSECHQLAGGGVAENVVTS